MNYIYTWILDVWQYLLPKFLIVFLLINHVWCNNNLYEFKSFPARPSNPQGPMKISDISTDRCLLEWLPPRDDGGSKIINYLVQKCAARSADEWTNVTRVCRYPKIQVKDLQEGTTYTFRVKAKNSAGLMSEPLLSEPVVTKTLSGK